MITARKILLATLATVASCVVVGRSCEEDGKPAFLRDLAASGGTWAPCPVRSGFDAGKSVEERTTAQCAELTGRLTTLFPPGTPETKLKGFLESQGFRQFDTCQTDQAIHTAEYDRTAFLSDMFVSVAWGLNEDGTLGWIRGMVVYSAP